MVQDNACAGLVCSALFELNLAKVAEDVRLYKKVSETIEHGVWIQNSLMTNLRRMAGVELSRFDAFDDKFVALLDCLSQL